MSQECSFKISKNTWRKYPIFASAILFPGLAAAVYNNNAGGTITEVRTYDNGQILFRMSPMPTTNCLLNDYFSITSATVPSIEARNRYYAALLMSRALGRAVVVGYDSVNADCDNSRPRVFQLSVP